MDIIEARVDATLRAVSLAKNMLPRLLQIGLATQESDKRRMARHRRSRMSLLSENTSPILAGETDIDTETKESRVISTNDVFKSIVKPTLARLVEHVAFCSLGCSNQGSNYKISATFGRGFTERIQAILNYPLHPTQTAKCALGLAELAKSIHEAN